MPGDEAVVLGHIADGPADERPFGADVVAEDPPLALGRGQEPEQDAEERALSGAVRPQEPDGPAFELQAHAVEGGDLPVAEMEVVDFQAHLYVYTGAGVKSSSSRRPGGRDPRPDAVDEGPVGLFDRGPSSPPGRGTRTGP